MLKEGRMAGKMDTQNGTEVYVFIGSGSQQGREEAKRNLRMGGTDSNLGVLRNLYRNIPFPLVFFFF